jgi:hypothetical protein
VRWPVCQIDPWLPSLLMRLIVIERLVSTYQTDIHSDAEAPDAETDLDSSLARTNRRLGLGITRPTFRRWRRI